jgi:NitT/TauT family transport system ATP-binding protein
VLVALAGVEKRFNNGTQALGRVDLEVARGEFLALLGPSGCGKSTILRLIAGLSAPSAGNVLWEGGHRPEPGDLGFVFQDATLMPWARVLANVALPLTLARVTKREREARARALIEAVGLGGFERALPRELSGGMRMRVSLARALVTKPRLLLMDEPFAALDEITRQRLNEDLLRLRDAEGTTIVFVTHSVAESAFLATRIAIMAARPGRITDTVALDLARPRDRGSPGYAALCADLSRRLTVAMAA